ncbi:MAG: DNA alkylation repair protein [Candidatus Paracaedibacteraceae bacterium]|nr:DNA alkylation repair protein [Candidatus Paracaedibacteraceae bacterium]
MNRVEVIKKRLQAESSEANLTTKNFFKTGQGDYAEHDQFIGVKVPLLRILSKEFSELSLNEIQELLKSAINEERLLALLILVRQYQQADPKTKDLLYIFYMQNLQCVNNWNLVDSSAYLILGAHIFDKDQSVLLKLAYSQILWERRIAIVATLYFIRNNKFDWTLKIALILLNDQHDLIHKAVGWMLKEVGKKDQKTLVMFLDQHAVRMPSIMLRCAIEKLPTEQRKMYLRVKAG